ncbi:EF-hand domain-containing protein [Puniceibacterium confluentis]|uniref:EF-hand domain-containing protein n=1 Tax=Puniceibacterium confluentis TaxID=1958944 RepID=UPI001645EC62|nr:EF-hand domain-containing protein [Puniceibacterium confluentis]
MASQKWITGACMTVLALSGGALQAEGAGSDAGAHGARAAMVFGDLDANGDGQLTQEEMTAHRTARFAAADADGDGLLTAEEMTAAAASRMAERTARMIKRMDRNDDGLLSPEEMRAGRDPGRMFRRVDSNGDGVVSAGEFAKVGHGMRGHHETRGRHGKRRHRDHDRG